jgi:hypothetical protein
MMHTLSICGLVMLVLSAPGIIASVAVWVVTWLD